jgi:hypothetical protein
VDPLVRLRPGAYISRDGRWQVGLPASGAGWLLRPADFEDLDWWNHQTFPNHYVNLAAVATFLLATFQEGTRPEQALSSLLIDRRVDVCVSSETDRLRLPLYGVPSRRRSRASTQTSIVRTSPRRAARGGGDDATA